jgi:ketosteroid isomerase-like protein
LPGAHRRVNNSVAFGSCPSTYGVVNACSVTKVDGNIVRGHKREGGFRNSRRSLKSIHHKATKHDPEREKHDSSLELVQWSVRDCGSAELYGQASSRGGSGAAAKGRRADCGAVQAPGRDAAIRGAIETVLRAQQDAWNGGDVQAFMDHYWKSDDLTFSSGGKTTRGWQATLAGYLERYPTREKMGRLTLNGLEITPLGDAAALVLGQWKLDGLGEPVGGNFTLVLRKINGRWVIVHDHTSRLIQ